MITCCFLHRGGGCWFYFVYIPAKVVAVALQCLVSCGWTTRPASSHAPASTSCQRCWWYQCGSIQPRYESSDCCRTRNSYSHIPFWRCRSRLFGSEKRLITLWREQCLSVNTLLKTAQLLLEFVECSDASFRDSVIASSLMVIVATFTKRHIQDGNFYHQVARTRVRMHVRNRSRSKKCSTVALVRMNRLMLRKRDSSHW
jgi:hypothetical protein